MAKTVVDPICGMSVTPGPRTPSLDVQGTVYHFCSASCRARFQRDPASRLSDGEYPLIIVGGGPAGLAAGIYASLGGLDTLLLSRSIGGQAWDSTEVFNYPGFAFVTGPDLVKRFQQQAFDDLHLAHRIAAVAEIERDGEGFRVRTEDGEGFGCRALLYTAGMRRRQLGVPGERELSGRGVTAFHAVAAERYAGRAVAVVGGGNSAVQAALGLAGAGARVTLVTRGYRADAYLKEKVTEAASIELLTERDTVRIEGTAEVEAAVVRPATGGAEERLEVSAVFVEIGLVPNSDLVRGLVQLNRRGEIEIDSNCRSSLPGLFAAGDVTSAYGKRILIAAGEGAKAALAAQDYLRTRGPSAP